MPYYANGALPLDPMGQEAVRQFLGGVWNKLQRMSPPNAGESPDEIA